MRQDVYKVAFEEANAELLDISKKFEELKRRKESLESAVMALAPILGVALPGPANAAPEQSESSANQPSANQPDLAAEPGGYSFGQMALARSEEETITDPFQQRVRNALKFSSNNGGERRGLPSAV